VRRATTVGEYAAAFTAGEPVHVGNLCGRITRGDKPADFDKLSNDPSRKIVMLMGPDGLEMMPGRTGYDMLHSIGYTRSHVEHLLSQGYNFKLGVFPESYTARLATWDNVLDVIGIAYPAVRDDLLQHRDALHTTSYAAIEQAAGYKFHDVDRAGRQDPRYMTYERFVNSPRDLAAARAFLYFSVHLRELYSGDGYTYTPTGERGLQEYVMVTPDSVRDLGDYALLDIRVELPQ